MLVKENSLTIGWRHSEHALEVAELPALMRFICKNGFEHHAAMNASQCAAPLAEAMETYLGWPVHVHGRLESTLPSAYRTSYLGMDVLAGWSLSGGGGKGANFS
jgi:hypothetical protein